MIAFLSPLVLTGLLALPLLWFLLRVFPPVPRMVHLPGAWMLDGLIPDRQTTSKTPWWILLLRTLIAALLIVAAAQPVINPAQGLSIRGAVRIVVDNGWAASQTWDAQREAALKLADSAARDRREVYVIALAPDPGQSAPVQHGPMTATQAETVLRGLKPRPWPADYSAAITVMETARVRSSLHSFWIGHGLADGQHATELSRILQNHGGLTYMEPEAARRPLLLLPRFQAGQAPGVLVQAAPGTPDRLPVGVEAVGNDGRVLDRKDVQLNSNDLPLAVTFDLPDALRGQIAQFRLSGRHGAGGVVLVDQMFAQRRVGLVGAQSSGQAPPLTSAEYYINRALEPTTAITTGTIDDLLKQDGLNVMILPDIGALPPATWEALEQWVRRGGLLLRFAGPAMSQAETFLTPTPLRRGGRALDGSLTWDKPQGLAPFPASSPLYGLTIPPDIEVRQQILAEPVADMERRVWAALNDGTPLITAAPMDRGLVVLVHTTATPDWSNLALSGLYVQMLQRFVMMAGAIADTGSGRSPGDGVLHPVRVLDGMGVLHAPDSTVQPIDAAAFDATQPDPTHPPGIYGRGALRKVMNIGDRIKFLRAMPPLPAGVERLNLQGEGREVRLMPFILAAAFMLFLIDWLLMMLIQGIGTGRMRLGFGTAAALVLCFAMPASAAENVRPEMVRYAAATHLAFIRSNNPEVDDIARRGLENLAAILNQRTSVEAAGVVALDPARDELSFFPLIYWPVTAQQSDLSAEALRNIQFYLDNGGTILFDTRDNAVGGTTRAGLALRALTAGLNVAPLIVAPDDHVLTKSFYLLRSFPGRHDNANVWVEEQSASGRDGVSSVIVGGNDWAAAWSGMSPADGSREQEMAFRFGVNLMMYALTGNYKADQVHIPHILERLGQ